MRPVHVLIIVFIVSSLIAPPAGAQTYPHCRPGEVPSNDRLTQGFRTLHDALGVEIVGVPAECEHLVTSPGERFPHAEQRTTTGLYYYRPSTGPVFTNGWYHWAWTASGLITWTGASPDPPADASPEAPSAGSAPAAEPLPRTVVVFVKGMGSDSSTGLDGFDTLIGELRSRYGWNDFWLYSYSGGYWDGDVWRWTPYGSNLTYQHPWDSSIGLSRLIDGLKARGNRVAVVGFSLGGLVAVEAIRGGSLPDATVAIASPLYGVNHEKISTCNGVQFLSAIGLVAGVATGTATLGLLGAAGLLGIPCPKEPLAYDLQWLWSNGADYTNKRELYISSLIDSERIKLMTVGSSTDCLYYYALCSDTFGPGDRDVRSTTMMGVANVSKLYRVPQSVVGINHLREIHGRIMYYSPVVNEVADFLAP